MKKTLLFVVLSVLLSLNIFSQGMNDLGQQPRVRAPELNGGKSWLNTDKPLSLAALKGKIVLLDFWTYGCINCIHIIPDLKKLEAKYANQLVVIGVHSAKFDNEKETDNIRNIILRYGVEHPVVNDADFVIWDSYAVRAWPTQTLIDPDGYVIRQLSGEGHYETLDKLIGETADTFRKKGKLNERPLEFALERAKVGSLPLAFPGKVLADAASNRLFIADSNHNRIVVTDLSSKLLETIGSGEEGLKDGDFTSATFSRPQGMFLDGDSLYVADTSNHAIRKVDLKNKKVETVAGDGKQAEWRSKGGPAKTSRISSPWDLAKEGNKLFIAMAGTHQIWALDFDTQTVAPYSGSGAEARYDAPNDEAGFAQPSGIVSDGKSLFVADSESNIIRRIDYKQQAVETLVGGDLFDFGDKDGEGDDVRLQHPLGVALHEGKVLIADTYNHKIKILDADKREVSSFLGSGKEGQQDGAKASFYEPGGLSVAKGKLYIADTNNHAIRIADLKTKEVSTLKIEGLTPPDTAKSKMESSAPNAKEINIDTKELAANSEINLNVALELPTGFHLNPSAPQRYEIETDNPQAIKITSPKQKFSKLPVSIKLQSLKPGTANVKLSMTVFYCREDNTGVCLIKTLKWKVPVKVGNGAQSLSLTESIK